MTGYLARPMSPDGSRWEVSKWEDDRAPIEIYTLVDRGKRGWSCTSPGCGFRKGKCKHVKVVEWRKGLPLDQVPDLMYLVQ